MKNREFDKVLKSVHPGCFSDNITKKEQKRLENNLKYISYIDITFKNSHVNRLSGIIKNDYLYPYGS